MHGHPFHHGHRPAHDAVNVEVVTASDALDLLTVPEVVEALRIDGSAEDPMLAALIRKAYAAVEADTGRCLLATTLKTRYDRFPEGARWGRSHDALGLPRSPLRSVESITYVDTDGATQTLDAADYQVVKHRLPPQVVPAFGASWPATRDQPEAVTVEYIAGYAASYTAGAVPALETARHAIQLLVGAWYSNAEAIVVGTVVAEVPMAARWLLDQIRVREVA